MDKRSRIRISLSLEERATLEGIAEEQGFCNVHQLMATLARVYIRLVEIHANEPPPEPCDEEYIAAMFRDCEQWEPIPDPEFVPRRHRNR